MMDLKGRIENLYRDFKTGKWNILLSLENYPAEEINDLLDCDIAIRLNKYRNKRSLDANAYFYVLVNKIAERAKISDIEVHDKLLSQNLAYVIENGAVDWIVADWKSNAYRLVKLAVTEHGKQQFKYYYDSLQDVVLNKTSGTPYVDKAGEPKKSRIFWHIKGSHEMDSKEMARLIDSTIVEAKELGIETLTCEELERMKASWK